MAPVDVSLRREEAQHHGRGVPGRQTITIRGRGSDRYAPSAWSDSSRRRPPRAVVRARTRPDRIAMWAVLLGVMLVLAAATSSHAASRTSHAVGERVALSAGSRAVHAAAARR